MWSRKRSIALAALALASLVHVPSQSASASGREIEPIAFVTPDRLQLPPPALKLTAAEANRLADAWIEQIDTADPALAAGALELLVDAPAPLIEAVASKLSSSDRLAKVLAVANSEVRGRIRNSRAMIIGKLLDFAPAAFIAELDAALESGDGALVASATSTAGGFRHLPAEVVDKVARALDAGKLGDQQRRELVALLRSYPGDLQPIEPTLRHWLDSLSADPVAAQRRDLALAALLAQRAPLPEAEVLAALQSTDLAVLRAAIGYLRPVPGSALPAPTLSPAMATEVGRLLDAAKQVGDWSAAFELLQMRAPAFLQAKYRDMVPAAVAQTWPAELAAEWLRRAPDPALKSLASRFTPSLYDSPAAAHLDCNVLRYRLGLLSVRTRVGESTLRDFWTTITDKTHGCRDVFDAEIDAYLLEAAKRHELGEELAFLAKQLGLGALPEWQPRSAALSRALAGELTRRMLAADWAGAKQMVLSGVRPSSTTLEQQGFWTNTKATVPGLGPEWFFRFVQVAGSAPGPTLQYVALAATDAGLDPVARATALIALASTGQVAQRQEVFNSALMDGNELVSRTALLLLASAYDDGLPKNAFKDFDRQYLTDVLTRRDLSGYQAGFLPRLVRFGPAYALLQAEQASWSDQASKSCLSLAPARPLGVNVGISVLDAVTIDEAAQRACVGLLFDATSPVAIVARHWEANPIAHPEHLLGALQTLWESPDFKSAGSPLRKRLATVAANAGAALPYDLESQRKLAWWAESLDKEQPAIASQFETERRKRWAIGALLAVPAVVLLHLSVWAVLLAGYPTSPTLQAVVFWNPFVRKVLGFGYIDLVLLYVPFARRRLFAPFAPEFLRDVRDTRDPVSSEQGYFAGSLVQHRAARSGAVPQVEPESGLITSALVAHRGRVLLLGKSGLGKSSFLRFWLSRRAQEGRDILVYLRADQCRSGVETEIVKRMNSVGSDQNLLRSVLYAGRMFVYIDGYNEVDLTTQDAITAFVGDYPHGNILVTSQIPLRGFTGIETFELLPLDRRQVRDFLTTRHEILPHDAVVRDALFQSAAGAFLDDVWGKVATDEEVSAFEEILANPMDLTSVALLLAQGRVPDLFALERQQFDAVKRRLQAQGLEFRTLGFSRALLTQRLSDQEDLGGLPFKPEVTELVHAKLAQVRTFSEPSGKASAQEIRFRHDRIRDFFSHFVLLEMKPEEQAAHAKDARFAGVFPYLARSMPEGNAQALRERLITLAAQIEDHRVSDSFVREFSWRQRFATQDPAWMLSHDLPAARAADGEYAELARQRDNLEAALARLRDKIESSRRMTRVLASADSVELVALAREILLAMGAGDSSTQQPIGTTMTAPNGQAFVLIALAQQERIRPFHVDLLQARVAASKLPQILVVNSQVSLAPEDREADLTPEQISDLRACRALVLNSTDLYASFRSVVECDDKDAFWTRLIEAWASSEPSTDSHLEAAA